MFLIYIFEFQLDSSIRVTPAVHSFTCMSGKVAIFERAKWLTISRCANVLKFGCIHSQLLEFLCLQCKHVLCEITHRKERKRGQFGEGKGEKIAQRHCVYASLAICGGHVNEACFGRV